MNLLRIRRVRKRAISEVMGSLLMIAITLVAGTAIFGFVNMQSSNSALAVGKSAAQNVNFLNEREVILLATKASSTTANIYVFNSGSINPETFLQVMVLDSTKNVACPAPLNSTATVPVQQTRLIHVTPSGCGVGFGDFDSGDSYTFTIVGQYGSSAQIAATFSS